MKIFLNLSEFPSAFFCHLTDFLSDVGKWENEWGGIIAAEICLRMKKKLDENMSKDKMDRTWMYEATRYGKFSDLENTAEDKQVLVTSCN